MTRTPNEAVDWALATTKGYPGMCLQFVRTAYGIPAKYGSARTAWQNATSQVETSDAAACPRGYPIWLDHPKSVHGHVAISLGGGLIRTTNSATGLIHTHNIATWHGWGYRVLGWAAELNGVAIPGGPNITASSDADIEEIVMAGPIRLQLEGSTAQTYLDPITGTELRLGDLPTVKGIEHAAVLEYQFGVPAQVVSQRQLDVARDLCARIRQAQGR